MTLPTPRTTAVLLTLAAMSLAGCAPAPLPAASGAGRAALIVVGADGLTRQACVTLEGSEATGRQLLEGAGLPVVLDDRNAMGALVCSIDGQGCDYPAEACFCQCEQLGSCTYWAYFVRPSPGDWTYSALGVSAQPVRPGEVHVWIWLDASKTGTQAVALLPDVGFDQVCP
jgi:hypothetical protein